MTTIVTILTTLIILAITGLLPLTIVKTYLAIENHFIKKDILNNKFLYLAYLNKTEEREKYGRRDSYIRKRKIALKNKVDNYYNEIHYLPKYMVSCKETEIEQTKIYISEWETIRQRNWEKLDKIDTELNKWKKFHSLKTYDEEKIRQILA